jgi:hypothetical protein
MLLDAPFTDPWLQTIGLLTPPARAAGKSEGPARRGKTARRPPPEASYPGVVVSLIDRPTSSTATIAWRDPTRCCYGDQVWRASRARGAGVCAMSGREIVPGDAVYIPRPCRRVPANAGAMILTSVLDEEWWKENTVGRMSVL